MADRTTTLVLLERMRSLIVADGQVNKHALRASFGDQVTDRQFGMAWSQYAKELRSEGLFIKPTPGQCGIYRIASAEDVVKKAIDTSRHAVVKKIRDRGELLVNAQKCCGLDEESRVRLNTEEVVYSRFVQVAERMLLKASKKKPEGL